VIGLPKAAQQPINGLPASNLLRSGFGKYFSFMIVILFCA